MIIGITTTSDEKCEYELLNREYIERVIQAGGTPVLLAPVCAVGSTSAAMAQALANHLDALVLSGGGDIDPVLYGQEHIGVETAPFDRARDNCELALARLAHERDLPVLGICRGMQAMNVALGGTLHQDVIACGLTVTGHQQQPPYSTVGQTIDILRGSLLARLLCKDPGMTPEREDGKPTASRAIGTVRPHCSIHVNTMHHQAIADLAPGLLASAISDDGIIEAVEDPTRTFFLGVQWHPEYIDDNAVLFEALVRAAQIRRMKRRSAKHS